MSRVMAGDSSRDLVRTVHVLDYYHLVSNNALYPVDELLPAEYFEGLLPLDRGAVDLMSFQGNKYTFGFGFGPRDGGLRFALYNKTILDQEGLPDPYELYREGNWTWNRAEEIARESTRDTTGDGEIDQWGLTNLGAAGVVRFATTNEANIVEIDEDGRQIFAFDRGPAIETLRQVHEWREVERIMDGGRDDFIEGNAALHFDSWIWEHRFPKADMEDDWDCVPMPMGPNASRHYYPINEVRTNYIMANAENPEGLIALHEFLYRNEDEQDISGYVDRYMISRQHLEIAEEAWEVWDGEGSYFERTAFYNEIVFPAVNGVITGERSPEAAMDEIQPAAQAWLNDFFGQ